jgi:hypothetical protein
MKAIKRRPNPSMVPITLLLFQDLMTPPQYKASNKHFVAPMMSTRPGKSIWRNLSFGEAFLSGLLF